MIKICFLHSLQHVRYCLLVGFLCKVIAALIEDQSSALLSIYSTFNGPSWTYNLTKDEIEEERVWFNNVQRDPCSPTPWYGLVCSEDNTTVLNITLRESNLEGTVLQNTFDGLNTSTKIDLYNNSISGELPISLLLSNTSLVHLDLGSNKMYGEIPSWIQYFVAIEKFYINDNNFTGTIPTALCELRQLQNLLWHINQLTGSIPPCLGNLDHISQFLLGSNLLIGTIPDSLYNFEKLTYLDLQYNYLQGPLMDLLRFPHLQIVYLDSNFFSGRIYENISSMQDLQILCLSSNQFTGTVPVNIGNVTTLQQLYLYSNFLTGPMPALGLLSQLETLLLRNNKLSGTLPSDISHLNSLKVMDLSNNILWGTIPDSSFSTLVNLELLLLSNNKFSGLIPSMASNIALQKFDVSGNKLSGEIPPSLFTLPNLQLLSCAINCLTKDIPESVCETQSIQELYLSGLSRAPACSSLFSKYSFLSATIPDCLW